MLPNNYILRSLLEARTSLNSDLYHSFLNFLFSCQRVKIRNTVVNINNRFNEVFSAFNSLNREFSLGLRIINSFTNHFSFHSFKKSSGEFLKSYLLLLNDLMISSLLNFFYALIVTDTSIKNNIATSITYIYICNKDVIKTIYYVVNVLFIEAYQI